MRYRGRPFCDRCEYEIYSDDAIQYLDHQDLCESCHEMFICEALDNIFSILSEFAFTQIQQQFAEARE